MDADPKATAISALVQQLKTGQISKSELFEKLSELQRTNDPATVEPSSGDAINSGAPAPPATTSQNAEPADSRAIIQRLIDEKRRAREQSSSGRTVPQEQPYQSQEIQQPNMDGTISAAQFLSESGQQPQYSPYPQGQADLLQQQAQQLSSQQQYHHQQQQMQQQQQQEQQQVQQQYQQQQQQEYQQQQQYQQPQQQHEQQYEQYQAEQYSQHQQPQQTRNTPSRNTPSRNTPSRNTPSRSTPARQQRYTPGRSANRSSARRRPQSARIDRRRPQTVVPGYPGMNNSSMRMSQDDSMLHSGGASQAPSSYQYNLPGGIPESKAQQAANEIREKSMAECTFKPQIKPLPAHYGAKDSEMPFHQRVMRWKDQKESSRDRRAGDTAEEEMLGCTFHPQINKVSKEIVDAKGSRDPRQPASERLFQNARKQRAWEETEAKAREREEEEFQRTCTFKPQINRSSRYNPTPVRSRYMEPTTSSAMHQQHSQQQHLHDASDLSMQMGMGGMNISGNGGHGTSQHAHSMMHGTSMNTSHSRRSSHPAPLPTGMDECTFTPKINGVKANMSSAHLYLEKNIFDRLSEPCPDASVNMSGIDGSHLTMDQSGFSGVGGGGGGAEPGAPVMNMSSFMSMANMEGARQAFMTPGEQQQGQQGRRQRPASAGSRRSDMNQSTTSMTSEERRQSFHDFLNRQNQAEIRKQNKIQQLRSKQQEQATPHINKRSKQLSRRNGDFLERVKKDSLRKAHEARHKNVNAARDPECTFKPQINKSAKKRHPRSVNELSRGDMLKRETTQRLMKLKTEQNELKDLTFQPDLSSSKQYKDVQGKLRILSEPNTYLQRLQKEATTFSDKQRRAMQQQEMREVQDCTFRPQIHDAPAYVKRIANSMRLTRAMTPATKENEKPEWK